MNKKIIIESIERLNNTIYGNPRYKVIDSFGRVFKTASDSVCGYVIDYSLEGKEITATYHETKAGNLVITYIEK